MLKRLQRDQRGATAIEFALIGGAMILFVLSIIGLGLYFMTGSSLQHGVQAAARLIRTGQSNEAAMKVSSFRDAVCRSMNIAIDCKKMSILVNSATDWSGLSLTPCLTNGNMSDSTGDEKELLSKYAGKEEQVVVVTVCYRWEMAKNFPFLKLGNPSDGSGAAILQAATAFRSEPYH